MSSGLPTISVVTPSFNQGRFIGGTIRSVLGQTYAPVEYFVMDGGSNDETVEVLKGFGEGVRWVSEKDKGQGDAIDRGFRKCSGEVVAWLNSDDRYAHEGVLERVAGVFAGDPAVDIVYGDGEFVDVEGRVFRRSRGNEVRGVGDLLVLPAGFALQPSVFFRKRVYLECGGIDGRYFGAFDYDLWLRMFAKARRAVYVPEVWSQATCHADAKSVRGMARLIRELVEIKKRGVREVRLGVGERLRMRVNVAGLWAYYAAVRMGLRRAV